jgi:hypothetical protein
MRTLGNAHIVTLPLLPRPGEGSSTSQHAAHTQYSTVLAATRPRVHNESTSPSRVPTNRPTAEARTRGEVSLRFPLEHELQFVVPGGDELGHDLPEVHGFPSVLVPLSLAYLRVWACVRCLSARVGVREMLICACGRA